MKSLYLQIFLQKFLYLLRRGGAAALADTGLAAAASVQGGIEGFGQGADVAAGLRDAVAGALLAGRQSGAETGGGLAQPRGQTVQAVRVEAGDGADGRLVGAKLCGQCVEELTAQAEVGEFQGCVLVVHPVYGHSGLVDLRTALEHSCNIFFYDVGRRLGVDTFSAMAQQLGLAAPTGVEVAEARGRLTWSSDGNYQAGLTLMAAIGQGNTAVTPLQLAAYAATLANYGQRPALHYADRAVSAATGETLWQYTPTFTAVPGGEAVFGPIRDGMTISRKVSKFHACGRLL